MVRPPIIQYIDHSYEPNTRCPAIDRPTGVLALPPLDVGLNLRGVTLMPWDSAHNDVSVTPVTRPERRHQLDCDEDCRNQICEHAEQPHARPCNNLILER
jgi:hypothetical protein